MSAHKERIETGKYSEGAMDSFSELLYHVMETNEALRHCENHKNNFHQYIFSLP